MLIDDPVGMEFICAPIPSNISSSSIDKSKSDSFAILFAYIAVIL